MAWITELHRRNQMTVWVANNLFTQRPKHELDDFNRWIGSTKPYQGDHAFRLNGVGEMLVFSAVDFEDFLEPRPDLDGVLKSELEAVIHHLAAARWQFRLHATYNESIERFLSVLKE